MAGKSIWLELRIKKQWTQGGISVQDCMSAALLCGDRIQGKAHDRGHSVGLQCQLSLRNVEAVRRHVECRRRL